MSDAIFPMKITMTGCVISRNSDGAGAVLQFDNYAVANVSDCVFTDNRGGTTITDGTENGGGVSVGDYATLNLTDCAFNSTIDENFVLAKENGQLNLVNPTVSAPNVVFARGPFETQDGSKSLIADGTISGLKSVEGGALYLDGETTVKDILLAQNIGKFGGAIFVAANGKIILDANIRSNHTADFGAESRAKGVYVLGSVTMIGGEIANNNYGGNDCGGVYVGNGGIFTMQSDEKIDANGNKLVTFGVIKSNYGRSSSIGGGGLSIDAGGTAVIKYGQIIGNYDYTYGGGVFVSAGGTLITEENALIADNYFISANTGNAYGAGIYNAGTVIMNGGTISGNYYTTGNQSSGGGIYSAANSSLTIKNATISNNTSGRDGGGLYLSTGCVAYIENTNIIGNRVVNNYQGAAIYTNGAELTIIGGEISDNRGPQKINYFYNSNVNIKNCNISFNKSVYSATIQFEGASRNLTIENCLFKENISTIISTSTGGNLFYIPLANKVIIKNCVFTDLFASKKSSNYDNSAIIIQNTNIFEMEDCIISGNFVKKSTLNESGQFYGGGLGIRGNVETQAIINNCDFIDNVGTGNGGALSIILTNASAVVDIEDCTFTGNQTLGYYDTATSTWFGGNGGAIYLGGAA
ncbi:MAG: right-handed parallel beta-helix repeat-containing protein, partial [Sphingobacteriia bacterium]|nr:right-handed parallel beta-helix repeat-containing protein [Sphingobacteriia bacterium]